MPDIGICVLLSNVIPTKMLTKVLQPFCEWENEGSQLLGLLHNILLLMHCVARTKPL